MMNVFFRGATVLLIAAAANSQGLVRPSFEVASVQVSDPVSNESARSREIDILRRMVGGGVKADPAQVRFTFKTLEELICLAYRVKAFQISAPDKIGGTRYDIAAKMPDGVSTDLVPEMLQSLLEDRFQLKYHRASKDFDVYILSVADGGVKIPQKPADYRFEREASAYPSTMESLGNSLSMATGRPVLDQTGLHGEYMVPTDFRSVVNRGIVGQLAPDAGTPERAMEVPTAGAIRRSVQELGLSLTPSKQPFPTLVVDHVETKPTEN